METRHEIKGQWTLSFTHPVTKAHHRIAATVPGNVEIDLQREGLIGDPYPPDSARAMRVWETVDDWVYETVFDAPALKAGEKAVLVFEGIDTIADVLLNGEKILRCENMFIPHECDVTGKLRASANTLRVRIFSPEIFARQFSYNPAQMSRDRRQESAFLRKARHMWGWDNSPRLVSAGLWRPVCLSVRPAIGFRDVYAYTKKIIGGWASIGVNWSFETPDLDLSSYRGTMILSFDGREELKHEFDVEFIAGSFAQNIEVPPARLWWPRGYGEPNLYDLTLQIHKDDQVVAQWNSKFGIREIELLRTEVTNEKGEGEFLFKCNGEKIYVRGTNWKTLDALPSRAAGKVQRALDLCVDLNCNMIRVWGGAVFEDHDFFDFCDRTGLMVWQDFMFACEFPPQDPAFQETIAREAEVIVKRLRNHPSLALWCGDNEDDMTVFWGLLIPPAILPSFNKITREVLKNAVLTYDPFRSYLESSPYVSDLLARDRWADGLEKGGNRLQFSPEQHIYATGKESFRSLYGRSHAHFVSETGPFFINAMTQSPDIAEREMARARRLWNFDTSKGFKYDEYHQYDGYFLAFKQTVQRDLLAFFGREWPLEPWADLALGVNIVVGDLFKFAIEHFRIHKWRKTGVIWWSLLDMWPMGFNYSVVDSNFRPKQPVYDWIRQSQQALCLMAEESSDGQHLILFAANDSLEERRGKYRVYSIDASGAEQERLSGEFSATRNATVEVKRLSPIAEQALLVLEWTVAGQTGRNHFICGRPPFKFEVYRQWNDCLERLYKTLP
jgi:beta-mannosidase